MEKKEFSVYPVHGTVKTVLICALIITAVPLAFTIFDGIQHPACYVCFALLVTPAYFFAIWAKRFRITVKENVITVRRGIGTKYSFQVSEIRRVIRRLNHTWMRNAGNITLGKITVKTKKHKLSVDSLMVNIETLDAYLQKNVPQDLIITKEITWKK